MRYLLITSVIFVSACASTPKQREPAAVVEAPKGALELSQALQQGPEPTFAYLKTQTSATSFPGLNSRDPAAQLPDGLKAGRYVSAAVTKEKNQQVHFIRTYRQWSSKKRASKATELLTDFTCEKALETQALGYTMEIDFPADDAKANAQALHEKVLTCENITRTESFFRLAIFSIQKNDCTKALEYLNGFPTSNERGVSDRLTYLRGLCKGNKEVASRNPWGGYGILLTETKHSDQPEPAWYLTATSGNEDWDRLLASYIELNEKGKFDTIRYISSKLDYEKFRTLPISFQTSVLVMMSFAGADLSVFQTLHKYLSEHPEMAATSVTGLLFPIRYWHEIVENSKKVDPVLVKALIRQESAFNTAAKSRVKASGLMQLMYTTARIFGIKQKQELLKPEENIRAGSDFLAQLIAKFGSVELALAAYNAGPNIVAQWQKRYPTDNIDLFVEMIPYTETREYVRLVNRNYKIYQTLLTKPQFLGDLQAGR